MGDNKQLRAIIWAAVSSKRQADDDKESLRQQENDARALCEREGWRVVDVLIVPGHSRSYIDFYEMADVAQAAGIDAFHKLRQHWIAKDFDVLIVRDGDRFAREQAPVALMIGMIIQSGARIYSMQDGWVDASNHRFATAMIGYRASAEVDQLKLKQKASKDARTRQGVFMGSRIPYAFRAIRNEFGKIQSIEVDESKRRLLDDAAALLLEGVGWKHVERELFERFGHVDERSGRPFKRFFFYHLFHNPWTWGHGARRYKVADSPNGQRVGPWCYDESEPVPDGVLLERNTHTPVYTGEQAARLKAELRRRSQFQGGARPATSHLFTGLLLCGYCGYYMVYNPPRVQARATYRCHSRYVARARDGCMKHRQIGEHVVQAWLNMQLAAAIEDDAPLLFAVDPEAAPVITRTEAIQREIADVNEQIDTLIDKQAAAPKNIQDRYEKKIDELAQRLAILQVNLKDAERDERKHDLSDVLDAFQELKTYETLDVFWTASSTVVNQLLHRLMGNRRLVIKDGVVYGIADAPPHPRLSHGHRQKRKRGG